MSVPENGPPCRCDFVHRWLDAHEKYFPKFPMPITHSPDRTFGLSFVNHHYSQPIPFATKTVKLPDIVHAPYRVSPVKPMYTLDKPYIKNFDTKKYA